jgi:ABC-type oligopeptide transport system ATPase subunit
VGRSGSGKSSLFLVIFRIVEPESGTVHIDGLDIGNLGLTTLRRSLAMIPQVSYSSSCSILHQYCINIASIALQARAEVSYFTQCSQCHTQQETRQCIAVPPLPILWIYSISCLRTSSFGREMERGGRVTARYPQEVQIRESRLYCFSGENSCSSCAHEHLTDSFPCAHEHFTDSFVFKTKSASNF